MKRILGSRLSLQCIVLVVALMAAGCGPRTMGQAVSVPATDAGKSDRSHRSEQAADTNPSN